MTNEDERKNIELQFANFEKQEYHPPIESLLPLLLEPEMVPLLPNGRLMQKGDAAILFGTYILHSSYD